MKGIAALSPNGIQNLSVYSELQQPLMIMKQAKHGSFSCSQYDTARSLIPLQCSEFICIVILIRLFGRAVVGR
jgi:hypothetical protein